MNYLQLTIEIPNNQARELLLAALVEQGIEGFEESENALKAFVSEVDYKEENVQTTIANFGLKFSKEIIEPRNWNAEWESDFEPVVIEDFCTIRAHFHTKPQLTTHDIIITPKMSFGTGHHATTHLMVAQMATLNFRNKSVLDFGTGTGVLAILAQKLGATNVVAIDNDEWSFENAQENVGLNKCRDITVSLDAIETLSGREKFDIILANINRHILLHYMHTMEDLLSQKGILLMSGLMVDDEEMVSTSATEAGFEVQQINARNNWITILCQKI